MFKRLVFICLVLLACYIAYIIYKVHDVAPDTSKEILQDSVQEENPEEASTMQDFSFSKYDMAGNKELEVEGESADMFAKTVYLANVIAKAYADDMPVTITADTGIFDKVESVIHLQNNVVATTDDGARLKTDSLDMDINANVLKTDAFAEIERKKVILEGLGARCEQNFNKLEFYKRVKMVVEQEDGRIVVTCDGPLVVDYERNIAKFADNVVSVDARGILKSDYMDVYYNEETRDVEKIYAFGNVVIEQEGNQTYSDTVIYLAHEGRVILDGDPEVFRAAGIET